jgi:hypothetical protein
MPKTAKDPTLEDVQVMGEWNFTIQTDTPLFWLRSGSLDRYLLRFKANASTDSGTFGFVFHAEADGPGTDGCSFWIERERARNGACTKRYCLAGDALESRAVVTRSFPDTPGEYEEDVQMLLQGYTGCVFLQDKKVQIKFRLKHMSGSIAFYNTSKEGDVSFTKVAITALRRGPMEVSGILGRREKSMLSMAAKTKAASEERPGEAASAEMAVGLSSPMGAFAGYDTGKRDDSNLAGTFSTLAPTDTVVATGFRSTDQASSRTVSFRATAPVGRSERSGPQGASRTWGQGQQFRGTTKGRMRQSGSDSVLRKSGAVCSGTLTASSTMHALPLALNPYRSEQKLMKEVGRRDFDKGSCQDFVAMPLQTRGA